MVSAESRLRWFKYRCNNGKTGPRLSEGERTQWLPQARSHRQTDRQTDRQTSSPSENKRRSKTVSRPSLKEIPTVKSPMKDLPIIGMGASAGGLDAFEKFFKNMPPDAGTSFVLISHLSPNQKSLMPEILRKHTNMEVYQIEEGMVVKPNCIYVIRPGNDVILKNKTLHLIEPYVSKGIRHPIDVFFRSLADEQQEKAICIILSGTGTEGTLGLKAIKSEGGIVIAQQPESAAYDSMPASAIATGLVDYISTPEEMPGQIMAYLKQSFRRVRMPVEKEIVPIDSLYTILAILREHTGHDFSEYKPSTIKRRIEKRMVIHNIEDIKTYVLYLRENPKEIQALFQDFLISVTRFFRDPEAFTVLKEKVLPDLCKDRPRNSSIRVWVVGCATGEEAYSLAIIFKEYMEEHAVNYAVQIFATDIDIAAIEKGRAGAFPEGIAVDVSGERLKKYFTKDHNHYRIKKPLREMIIFSVQNVIKDPSFSKIDLICCRNLLIYVNAKLQKRMFSTFHYSLNRDGVLFLGTSETIGEFSNLFSVVDRKWKIYRRLGKEGHIPHGEFDMAIPTHEYPPYRAIGTGEKEETLLPEAMQKMLLDSYAPTCIAVDEKMQIRYFHGKVGRYLEPAEGRASLNLMDMVKEGLKNKIYAALQEARQTKQDISLKSVQVRTDGDYTPVTVRVTLLTQSPMKEWALVVFEEEKPAKAEVRVARKSLTQKEGNKLIIQLANELKAANQSYQMTVEELETSNEELQSTNEELQSSNEELQSTNEELETSREELQSLNEELATVNAELQDKIQEQTNATDKVNKLLSGLDIPIVFLDNELRIMQFTPQAARVINLMDRDIGRPFSHISTKILIKDIETAARDVLKSLSAKEVEVQSENGSWYLMKITPYQTDENTSGIILAFVDISETRRLRVEEQRAREYAEGIVDTVRESIIVLDPDFRVINANRSFYETFRVDEKETEHKLIYDLGNGQWDIPALRELLEKLLREKTSFKDFAVEHDFPEIGRKKMILNARRMSYKGEEEEMILLAFEDITDKLRG
jgi:two-component system, chemotaxis family, CheB/CheR fusion protein